MKPLDRELSLEQAKKNAEDAIHLLNLDYEVKFYGDKYGTTSCSLISRENRDLKYGSYGKGLTQDEAQFGFGCSIYPDLTLKRAITELLQFRVFSKIWLTAF